MKTRKTSGTVWILGLGLAVFGAVGLSGCEADSKDSPPPGGRALIGANPDLTPDIQGEQGYWYSRYSMSTLSMASGMGTMVDMMGPDDPFAPLVGALMPSMLDLANDCPAGAAGCTPPVDTATGAAMPQVPMDIMERLHPTLITRIFNGGDPSLANPFDMNNPGDTLNLRFVPSAEAGDRTKTAAYGWLAVKEVEWARQFHVDDHFGIPGPGDTRPLAQIRLNGLLIFTEALMQTKVLLDDTVDMMQDPPAPKTPTLFDWSDPAGNYVVLIALADLANTLRGDPGQGNVLCTTDLAPEGTVCSTSNRYRAIGQMMAPMMLGEGKTADDLAGLFVMAANMLVGTPMIPDPPPDLRSAAVATQAFAWLASAQMDANGKDLAKARMKSAADTLLAMTPADSVEQAASLRALIEAYRVLGDASYKTGALKAWAALQAKYDAPHGRWTDVATYTGDDLAFLFGALNALGTYQTDVIGATAADAERATTMLLDAFESTMDLGGFQVAAPPATPPFVPVDEYQGNDLSHRYPGMVAPPDVTPSTKGHGVAPVCANSITWTGTGWTVDRSRVDTADCMHLANEMLWFHSDEVSGFPTVR